MEFTNEIFFNKKLIQNETVLITYSGKLFKEYSAEITIVYGFGENWDYTQETKMQEKENGFEAAITLKNYDTFNFCFKNNYNIWDNNSGFNYIASIEPAKCEETEKVEQEENSRIVKETKEIEENKNFENTNITDDKPEIENNEIMNTTNDIQEISEEQKQANIEAAFDNLLNSLMDFEENDVNKNVNLENGFGLQSVDEIKETDFISCDDIFDNLYNELISAEQNNPIVETSNVQTVSSENSNTENEASKNKSNDDISLETLLNDFSEKQEKKNNIISSDELDEIMNNILNSIIEENDETENVTPISENTTEVSGLPTVKNSSSFEDFIDKCIDNTYFFFRNIWNGCKKVGVLIKQKTHELLGEDK